MRPQIQEEKIQIGVFAILSVVESAYRTASGVAAVVWRPVLWPVILFFIPKINLVGFRNETAGIRLDDVILLVVAILLTIDWIAALDFKIEPIPSAAFAVVAVFLFCNVINASHSNFLYSLRLAEYLIFFWTGKALIQARYNFTFLVKVLISLNCIFILLQFAGLIGGFATEGYEFPLDRPFGLSTNHPAEMGALLNLLFVALVFDRKTVAKFWYWCSLIALCIFITASRSALFAHFLLTSVYIYRHSKSGRNFVLRTAAVCGLLVTIIAVTPNSVSERSTALLSQQNLETFRDLYDKIPADKEFTGFSEGGQPEEAPEGVDASWYQRGFKWAQVLKTMSLQPWTIWIFGVGPGTLTPALDGGWLRVICETGIVGTLVFLSLLRKISRLSTCCSMAVFALAINMLMIDAHMAYKVVAFLFFLVGAQVQTAQAQTARGA